jgi:hypothetical protein
MPASFPTSAKVFSVRANGQVPDQGWWNDLQDEVYALETASLAGTFGIGFVRSLSPTLANVTTNSITTFLSAPISDWADGGIVEVFVSCLTKNNKSSPGGLTFNLTFGGQNIDFATATWADNATERANFLRFTAQRVGANVWVGHTAGGSVLPFAEQSASLSETSNVRIVSGPTFTGAQTLAFRLTLDATDASFYLKPQKAIVRATGTVA